MQSKNILWSLVLLMLLQVLPVSADNAQFGLYFRANKFAAMKRTTLSLDEGKALPIEGDRITFSFDMLVRESTFGAILHLTLDDGKTIHISSVSEDGKCNPAIVYNDDLSECKGLVKVNAWKNMEVTLLPSQNKILLKYDGQQTSRIIPMNHTKNVKALFGMGHDVGYAADVMPMSLKNVKVVSGGKTIRLWRLGKHNDETCVDEIAQKWAVAGNPVWLIDSHIQWKLVFQKKMTGLVSTAFNPKKSLFYIYTPGVVSVLDNQGKQIWQQKVKGGYKANSMSNGFMLFDDVQGSLLSYSLNKLTTSRFSFQTGTWDLAVSNDTLANFYNHARVYNPADRCYYIFGGYGYFCYHNNLFRIHADNGRVEEVKYANPIPPRFGAAMGIANGKLYILGGRGNKAGKQAVESYFYNDMWCIDLKTLQAEKVWERNWTPKGLVLASTMYYDKNLKAFYATNVIDQGGKMLRVSVADTTIVEVSKPTMSTKSYQDFDFNLYESPKDGKYYLVVDKIMVDKSHELAIFSIDAPLLPSIDISQEAGMTSDTFMVIAYIIIGIVVLLILLKLLMTVLRKKKTRKSEKTASSSASSRSAQTVAVESEQMQGNLESTNAEATTAASQEEAQPVKEVKKYFDRTKAAISLLGGFSVYDKEGENVTASFTPKLRDLLIVLILFSETKTRGISVEKITELLWSDKDDASARNNRNVSLRKLRLLLEQIGCVEVITSNGVIHVKWSKDVFCDYHQMLRLVNDYNKGEYDDPDEQLDKMLEILLYGPLLPTYEIDWLDDFKDSYSSVSIDLLNKLLAKESRDQHDELVILICDIIFLHDPLSEEALAEKCKVLSRQGKKGIAKRVYDRFCKEYEDSLAEPYEISFADVCKTE